jgi:acetyl-CoA C-acetyltransferase
MGETAENIYDMSCAGQIQDGAITREEQDRFALQSQQRAVHAINQGYFQREIVPILIPQAKGESIQFDTDEHPRYRKTENGYELATSLESLASLRPAFRKGGTVTAGNSSGLNDGACALVLMSQAKANDLGIKPLARWVASAAAGVDPRIMGIGPVTAAKKALARAGLSLDQIDLAELNEAFAVQSIAVMRELRLREEITNVNGGAIALGHPLGSSGARILTTLIYEMQRRAQAGDAMRYGLAMLCVGVGQGEATIIELIR